MKHLFARTIAALLCLCFLIGGIPAASASSPSEKPTTRGSYPVPEFRSQPLWEKIDRGIPLAISHKSDWRNYPENSLLGFNSCIKMGVDLIEVDFHVTKDGVPVALHDDNLRRVTNADTLVYIADITWAQAKKYALEDGMGNKGENYILTAEDAKVLNSIPTYVSTVGTAKAGGTMPIARFDSVLELVNKQAMLLMDKITTAEPFSYAFVCAKEWDMLDYVVFKGNYTIDQLEPWFVEGAALWNKKHPSEPITAQEVKTSIVFEYNNNRPANIQKLLDAGVRVIGLAAGVNASNEDHIRNTLVPYCREHDIYLRCNTGDPSYMGASAKVDSEIGWAELFEIGYTGVMTDRPGPLVNYIQESYRIRPASDRIDAEHFTDFNQDTFGFTVPEDWNAGKNKTVDNLTSKDTLTYANIEFDGTENILTAKAKGTNCSVTVYLDGTDAANMVGTLKFNSSGYASTHVKIKPVTPGKHTVYLKFSGTVSLDQFRFTRGLYFGFSNERLARFRYQDKLYGSINYDTGNWFPRPASMSSAKLDNTAGTMSVNLTAGGNHYIQTGSVVGDRPLHYIPQAGDHFQIRLKISNAMPNDAATAMAAGIVYSTASNTDFSYGDRVVQTITEAQLNGEYFTITLPMNAAFTGAKEITGFRLYFTNLAPISGKTSTITIDQVYIGPKAYLPQKDYLYFDFTDRDTDEMRYMTAQYGYQNFDNRQWLARTATMRGTWYDHAATTLLARVTTGGNHYIQTGTTLKERPLHYTPSDSDYLQMRLRIDNGVAYDASLPLSIGIAYASTAYTDFRYHPSLRKDHPATVIDSGFFTVTIPMPSFFAEETDVQSLRIYISNLAPKDGEAVIEVDSFYIGPKDTLPCPLYTVTFTGEDGTVLATEQAAQGDSVSYTGITPAKAPDEACHYSFAGWSISLTNITTDMTAVAQFHAVPHSFSNGVCVCGVEEYKAPVEDPTLKLNHSLNLASDISVNIAVSKTLLDGFDLSTVYVESTIDVYEGNHKTGTTTIRIEPTENEYYYLFTINGLTAVQMGDQISSVLYGTKDGRVYYSPTDIYSISDYAYSQMNKSSVSASLKTLCADLLRYGSAAQTFKSYRTDALCDSAMTATHRAYLSSTENLSFGNTNTVLTDLEAPAVTWAGKSLNLESKIAVKYIINAQGYHGSLEDLSLHISYTDLYGQLRMAILTELEPYNSEMQTYAYSFNGLLAAELRTVLSAQVYAGNTPVSATLTYSPDTYGNNKVGALGDLCTALIAYSDSAKSYFLAQG